uniref:NADH-ubiquinone oxidoreductase chain 1 n=1 Tax=Steromphala umbilicaris TaxID=2072697 RepID=A0A240F5J2_9VEST|nr:NADH dehydrogenase subunit 1 [Steromphala umbilicaris]AQD17681.1 NADH dehydrogenase subunit 1 [Steromphala umbilicaris]AQD17694.1 NADH dehydrogenase subunit 1 [Steromphala umbilicaris]
MTLSSLLCSILTYICVLLGVAFFTLLERKGLGYFQIRKGPNKVGLGGLPQPLADAAKLFTKELAKPTLANQSPYFLAPVLSLVLALLLWEVYPSSNSGGYFVWGILFFLCVSSLNVYGTLLAGWASNSKYALLGAIRAVAQTISYEVSLALILLFVLFVCSSFSFLDIKSMYGGLWLGMLLFPIALVWFVSCVAETNRAPFDFAEGESELVSGFNIEYSAGGFALIFMAEYGNILVMSLFTAVLFFGGGDLFVLEMDLVMSVKILFFAFVFVWVRATLPRFRYDLLMGLTWKSFLPVSLSGLIFVIGILFLFG